VKRALERADAATLERDMAQEQRRGATASAITLRGSTELVTETRVHSLLADFNG